MQTFFILVKDFILSSFRSKKAVIFLILYLGVFMLIAYGLIQVQARIDEQFNTLGVDDQQKDLIMRIARGVLQAQANNEIVTYLLSVPFFNLATFMVSLFGTPILIAIWKYDLIAQEAYDKTLRYLLFRVSRFKILMAKYTSSLLEIMGVTFIALLGGIIWARFQLPFFNLGNSLSYGILFFLTSQLFFSVIIAFTLMISIIVRKPFTALLFTYLGLLILAVLPLWIKNVSPFDSHFLGGLLSSSPGSLIFSFVIYLLFTALFLGGGFLIFRKRNY